MSHQLALILPTEASVQLRSYSVESRTHSHDYCQWVMPLAGHLALEIGNQAGIVHLDKAAFIAPQERHCFASGCENLFLILDVPTHSWVNHVDIPCFWDLNPTLKQFLQFSKIYLTQTPDNFVSNYMVKDFLLKLLSQQFLSNCDNKVSLAKNWIDRHFATPIDIREVAQQCYLSISQLQRRFKQAMGQGVADYWRQVRLQQAQLLLCMQKMPIEIVAHKVGYDNLASFSRSFIRTFGMAPSLWRKMTLAAKNMRPDDKVSLPEQ